MDESSGQPMSAAQRRRQRRLRSWYRHEQQTVAAALATYQHHSAPRGTEGGRCGVLRDGHQGGRRFRTCRRAASTIVGGAARRRRGGTRGLSFELVLNNVVPQMERLAEEPSPLASRVLKAWLWRELGYPMEGWFEEERASSSREKRRKKRKRRKKKLPKTSSSSFLHGSRGGAGDQGIMHDFADDETEDVIEYVQRADGPRNIHTVATYSLHAEYLRHVHCKEVTGKTGVDETAPCVNEMGKFIEEKVIREEETILKSGMPALNLYSDRTHLYIELSGSSSLVVFREMMA